MNSNSKCCNQSQVSDEQSAASEQASRDHQSAVEELRAELVEAERKVKGKSDALHEFESEKVGLVPESVALIVFLAYFVIRNFLIPMI